MLLLSLSLPVCSKTITGHSRKDFKDFQKWFWFSWTHPTSWVPQGGAEGPFLFLLVTLPLAFYIQCTYPDVAPYPLRTTLLAFADDMAVVTTTARPPLRNAADNIRARKVLHDVTSYLENNRPLVHNVHSATIVHNAPPLSLNPGESPMTLTDNVTYLGIQQGATPEGVTLAPNLEGEATRTLVIARIAAPSTQALAYFLQAVLNAAIRFQALHLTPPKHMLKGAVTTVRRAWAIDGHRPTSLTAEVQAASALFYGDGTDHLVQSAYTGHTATHIHYLIHNQEPEVREVFTLTVQEAQHHRNRCPQYILHKRGLSTTVGTHIWNHLQLLLLHHRHVIQTNHRCKQAGPIAVLHTDMGGGPTGEATSLDQVGTTLHLVRVTANQMWALPTKPRLAQEISSGKLPAKGCRHSRSPRTHRWRNP